LLSFPPFSKDCDPEANKNCISKCPKRDILVVELLVASTQQSVEGWDAKPSGIEGHKCILKAPPLSEVVLDSSKRMVFLVFMVYEAQLYKV